MWKATAMTSGPMFRTALPGTVPAGRGAGHGAARRDGQRADPDRRRDAGSRGASAAPPAAGAAWTRRWWPCPTPTSTACRQRGGGGDGDDPVRRLHADHDGAKPSGFAGDLGGGRYRDGAGHGERGRVAGKSRPGYEPLPDALLGHPHRRPVPGEMHTPEPRPAIPVGPLPLEVVPVGQKSTLYSSPENWSALVFGQRPACRGTRRGSGRPTRAPTRCLRRGSGSPVV